MTITTLGIDLAKSVFQLHGVDADGAVVLQKKLRRGAVLNVLGKLEPCLICIESCATSHHWAREIAALGHDVRVIPPAYVKPYVKRQKNDFADAEAICEVVTRPNMRFVPVKTEEQQGILVLHRSRDLLMRQRTMILNAIRAHFAEFGVVAAQGPRRVADLASRLRDDDTLGLPATARSALLALAGQLESLAAEVRNIERQLMAWHRQNAASQQLETIPGVGNIRHTTGANHRHTNRGLGSIASRAQAHAARHRRYCQEDGPNGVGIAHEGRKLQSRTGNLNAGRDSGARNAAMRCKGRSE